MAYFVTGATGFIGRYLVQELLDNREGEIFVLCREGSRARLESLIEEWTADGGDGDRLTPVIGDLGEPDLGVSHRVDHRARRRDRALLPPRRDLRHDRLGRDERDDERRRHPQRHRPGRQARGRRTSTRSPRSRPPATTAGSSTSRCSTRASGCPRRTTGRSSSPRRSSARSARCRGGSTARRSWSGTPRPARWTRSTAPTTSSRCSRGCATTCPAGCRWSASTSATPTWCRSTTSPRRWTTSRHKPGLDGQAFHLVNPEPISTVDLVNTFASAANAPQFAVPVDRSVTARLPTAMLPRALQPGEPRSAPRCAPRRCTWR